MADENLKAQKKKIQEERKRLKQDEKKQKKEIKKRAKEISKRESEIDDGETAGSKISSALVTVIIIAVWLAIIGFLIKMDFGGFGTILATYLKDVPVVNLILPDSATKDDADDEYGGYTSLKDAVEEIKRLELELDHANTVINTNEQDLATLQSEVTRLQEFEQMQVEFQRIKEQFYDEIIYSDAGPGPEGYSKYYEALDPTTAAALYKQVIESIQEEKEIKDYAATYAAMKPKAAAKIFENMKDDLTLVAKILKVMGSDSRGDILGAMDPEIAAKITKLMNPEG